MTLEEEIRWSALNSVALWSSPVWVTSNEKNSIHLAARYEWISHHRIHVALSRVTVAEIVGGVRGVIPESKLATYGDYRYDLELEALYDTLEDINSEQDYFCQPEFESWNESKAQDYFCHQDTESKTENVQQNSPILDEIQNKKIDTDSNHPEKNSGNEYIDWTNQCQNLLRALRNSVSVDTLDVWTDFLLKICSRFVSATKSNPSLPKIMETDIPFLTDYRQLRSELPSPWETQMEVLSIPQPPVPAGPDPDSTQEDRLWLLLSSPYVRSLWAEDPVSPDGGRSQDPLWLYATNFLRRDRRKSGETMTSADIQVDNEKARELLGSVIDSLDDIYLEEFVHDETVKDIPKAKKNANTIPELQGELTKMILTHQVNSGQPHKIGANNGISNGISVHSPMVQLPPKLIPALVAQLCQVQPSYLPLCKYNTPLPIIQNVMKHMPNGLNHICPWYNSLPYQKTLMNSNLQILSQWGQSLSTTLKNGHNIYSSYHASQIPLNGFSPNFQTKFYDERNRTQSQTKQPINGIQVQHQENNGAQNSSWKPNIFIPCLLYKLSPTKLFMGSTLNGTRKENNFPIGKHFKPSDLQTDIEQKNKSRKLTDTSTILNTGTIDKTGYSTSIASELRNQSVLNELHPETENNKTLTARNLKDIFGENENSNRIKNEFLEFAPVSVAEQRCSKTGETSEKRKIPAFLAKKALHKKFVKIDGTYGNVTTHKWIWDSVKLHKRFCVPCDKLQDQINTFKSKYPRNFHTNKFRAVAKEPCLNQDKFYNPMSLLQVNEESVKEKRIKHDNIRRDNHSIGRLEFSNFRQNNSISDVQNKAFQTAQSLNRMADDFFYGNAVSTKLFFKSSNSQINGWSHFEFALQVILNNVLNILMEEKYGS